MAYSTRNGVPTRGKECFFFMPVCANKVRNGPASTDQGLSIASLDSCHVHSMLWLCPPTSFYFILFGSTKLYCIQPMSDNAKWRHQWLGLIKWQQTVLINFFFFLLLRYNPTATRCVWIPNFFWPLLKLQASGKHWSVETEVWKRKYKSEKKLPITV